VGRLIGSLLIYIFFFVLGGSVFVPFLRLLFFVFVISVFVFVFFPFGVRDVCFFPFSLFLSASVLFLFPPPAGEGLGEPYQASVLLSTIYKYSEEEPRKSARFFLALFINSHKKNRALLPPPAEGGLGQPCQASVLLSTIYK